MLVRHQQPPSSSSTTASSIVVGRSHPIVVDGSSSRNDGALRTNGQDNGHDDDDDGEYEEVYVYVKFPELEALGQEVLSDHVRIDVDVPAPQSTSEPMRLACTLVNRQSNQQLRLIGDVEVHPGTVLLFQENVQIGRGAIECVGSTLSSAECKLIEYKPWTEDYQDIQPVQKTASIDH